MISKLKHGARTFCFREPSTAADGAITRYRGPATAIGHRRRVQRKFGRQITKRRAHVAVSAGGVSPRHAGGRAADALLHVFEAVGVRELVAVVCTEWSASISAYSAHRRARRTCHVEKVHRMIAGAGGNVGAMHCGARRRQHATAPFHGPRAENKRTGELAFPQRLRDVVQQADAVCDLHLPGRVSGCAHPCEASACNTPER